MFESHQGLQNDYMDVFIAQKQMKRKIGWNLMPLWSDVVHINIELDHVHLSVVLYISETKLWQYPKLCRSVSAVKLLFPSQQMNYQIAIKNFNAADDMEYVRFLSFTHDGLVIPSGISKVATCWVVRFHFSEPNPMCKL